MQNFKLTKKQNKTHRQKEIENGRKVKMIAIEHYEVASVLYISTFWNSLYNMQIYIYTCMEIDMTHTNMRYQKI